MLFFKSNSLDPFFNLATEEYLTTKNEDFFITYINKDCVVVGHNQNTFKEVNLKYAKENNIKIVRRLSGGGSVFHDENNLNFSFITSNTKKNIKQIIKPILLSLKKIGINANFSGRNDIKVNDYKISGVASYFKNNKRVVHGTLIYDININKAKNVLIGNKQIIKSKQINSKPNKIISIKNILEQEIKIEEIINILKDNANIKKEYTLTNLDTKTIKKEFLVNYKENKIINKNKNYSFSKEEYFKNVGLVNIEFDVIENKIKNLNITGDFFNKKEISDLIKKINNINHDHDLKDLKNIFKKIKIDDYIKNLKNEEFINMFF